MPADSATTSLALLLMGTGNDDNTWGDLFNAQVIQYIEDALVGRTAKSTTGGATTLSQAECRPRYLDISGTLSSDATFTVPNTKNSWIITNSTTGAFGVLFKTSGGTATVIPQGTSKEVYCDGADGVLRVDRNLVGEFFFHGGTTVPAGALECTGAAISRAGLGLDLFGKVSTTYGVGNGATTYNLPDGYTAGKFLRSRTASVALGTAQGDQNAAHTHTGTADAGGDHSHGGATASGGSHTHTGTTDNGGLDHTHSQSYVAFNGSQGGGGGGAFAGSTGSATTGGASAYLHTHTFTSDANGSHTHTISASGTHTHTFTTASSGGTEARPTNLSGIMCIRL